MTREEQIKKQADIYTDDSSNYTEWSDDEGCYTNDIGLIEKAFIEGAKWADNNHKSPWISVKDYLPCNNPNDIHFGFTNYVIAIDENKNVIIAFMRKDKNDKWFWCSDDDYDLSYRIITHWMPIPKLSENKNE